MKPRIWVDATTIVNQIDGLSHYIIGLLMHMPEEAFKTFEISVLINPTINRPDVEELITSNKFNIVTASIAPIGPQRDWDLGWFLLRNKKKFDIFHSTSTQYPLFLKGGIATVHDLTFKKYFNGRFYKVGLAKMYLNLICRHAAKHADVIVAVSNSTSADLLKYYKNVNGLKEKSIVVHEGWEHIENEADFMIPPNIPCKNYFFYLGSSRIHKNLHGLLNAFEIALSRLPEDINLLISGNMSLLSKVEKLKVDKINSQGERIFFSGVIPPNELASYYKNARAFIFPSFSEGFGLPILESFYFKVPLLCSNISSFPEIAGDAALYFNPFDVNEMAKAMVNIIEENELAEVLVNKGTKRLKLFSWKQTSQNIFSIYQSLAKKKKYI